MPWFVQKGYGNICSNLYHLKIALYALKRKTRRGLSCVGSLVDVAQNNAAYNLVQTQT